MSTWQEAEDDARRRYEADTGEHVLEVLHESGEYRHLRWAKPGTMMYGFDVHTAPGLLIIRADMGDYTLSREREMIPWLRGGTAPGSINPGYWGEKVRAAGAPLREFDEGAALRQGTERIREDERYGGDWAPGAADRAVAVLAAALEEEYPTNEAHHRALYEFEVSTEDGETRSHHIFGPRRYTFSDSWEMNLTEVSSRWLYCCVAVRDVLDRYVLAKMREQAAWGAWASSGSTPMATVRPVQIDSDRYVRPRADADAGATPTYRPAPLAPSPARLVPPGTPVVDVALPS